MKSRLILDCRESDKKAMATLMIRFWPFVDEFPKIIEKHKELIIKKEKWHYPFSIWRLASCCKEILSERKYDEENHRQLWLNTSLALGLSEDHLYYPWSFQNDQNPQVIFRVLDIIDIVGKKSNSSTILLRLAAIKIIAESISHELLVVFNDFGREATELFRIHISHKEGAISLEELAYRLAFAFDEKALDKERINKIIQDVVDLFVEVGEKSY